MSTTSKGLGIAGSIVMIVTTLISSIIAIIACAYLLSKELTGTDKWIAAIIVLVILAIGLMITIVFPIIILVFLTSKDKSNKKILAAGILSIIVAALSILGSISNPIYWINLISAGLLLASGIMICNEYKKAK
ncbi:hypothetical protein [Spiroplasma floricola]|uniref:Uncharacterized protein n=1 Tax=Spiroplasma floricola 23-6 TaxID=1336749 RepID=A0A2K8SFJ4_9MOLU|nr:hypothetical protein [Spiroplasma floricola]AUB31600.1 hypothetical protein SFLOR_v1c05480 [Spiroplasma floricola 23-6]